MKTFRITFHLKFVIDAMSKKEAYMKAENEAMDWLRDISSVESDEITIKEIN